MKFDVKSDDFAMALSVLGAASCGVSAMAAPKRYQDIYLEKTVPRSDHTTRWMGHGCALTAALMAGTMGDRMTSQGKKDMFKITGAAWTTVVGHTAIQLHNGNQKNNAATAAQLALGTGVAALTLWKGFKKD